MAAEQGVAKGLDRCVIRCKYTLAIWVQYHTQNNDTQIAYMIVETGWQSIEVWTLRLAAPLQICIAPFDKKKLRMVPLLGIYLQILVSIAENIWLC